MKKIILLIMMFFMMLVGCQKKEENKHQGCDINEECNNEDADMSEYELFDENEDYVYVKSNVKEMYDKMNNHDTCIYYYGFARCPWCRDLMPILNEAAKKTNIDHIYYVDTRENSEWKSNIDIDDYDLFVEKAGEYLELDENNIKHLYTPFVILIKEGNIISTISAPDYDAHEEKISDELKEELLNNLIEEINKLK